MDCVFPEFPNESRLWLYPSSREMTEAERTKIDVLCKSFVEQWAAHGNKLWAGAKTISPFFLAFVVNDALTPPSGCSIDASVRFVKQLEKEMQLDFFNRLKIVVEIDGNPVQQSYHDLETLAKDNSDLRIFDPLISSLGKLRSNWPCPVEDSSFFVG
jgi:hypothetical protein